MAKHPNHRGTAGAWFDSFGPVDPPGWDEQGGWCRRHWAPLAQIPDPAQRGEAQRLASMDLMVTFAATLRRRVAPLPLPAHQLTGLVRRLAPVCCTLVGDSGMREIVTAAIDTAGTSSH